MSAFDDFTTAMTAAAVALDGGDYTTARRKVILARMYLAQIPNAGADGASMQWREDLALIESSITLESGRSTRSVTADHYFSGG